MKLYKGCDLKFIGRINNDGKSIIDNVEVREFMEKETYTVFCLSISHKKWVATDGMSTYIVEIK